ncbi:MAG TPA: outer membrane protein assembly factor BamA [Candidatus Omnitrophota bacterium]|nr:outer membrane protein assembly factor BamA [Candidatus Omnitrophota bacterium]HPS37123.1 outer membrane protein assembly factor BamA [Candidatus Omnitrophota bacterium]
MKRFAVACLAALLLTCLAFPAFSEETKKEPIAPVSAVTKAAPSAPGTVVPEQKADATSAAKTQEPAAVAAPAAPQAPVQPEKKIIAVEVRGNRIVSTNTILSKIQSKQGMALKQQTINEDIKRLYGTGFFDDIRLDVEEQTEGYKLIAVVDEKPIVRQIQMEGFTAFKEDKLRKTLGVIEGQILDRKAVKKGEEEIRKLYTGKGFRFVDIQTEVNVDPKTKEAVIKIKIFEGQKFKISKISFEGVKAFKTRELSKLMKTKEQRWVLFGTFKEDVFEKDLEKISFYYQKEGYLDVKVVPEFAYDKNKNKIRITIKVEEGAHYVTGEVKFKGNTLFPESELWQQLEMLPGLTYSQFYVAQDIEKLRQFYNAEGYIEARVVPDVKLNRENNKVDIVYEIQEGDLYFVEKVQIRGNTKTRDKVIRRELRIRPGERFDGSKIEKSKQRLENLNYFEEVTYDTEPTDTAPNRKDLIFRVKEKRTGELSFGGGVSSIDTFMGFAEISQRNFDILNWPRFTGGGQSLSIRGQLGTIHQEYDISFVEPYLFNKPISWATNLYHTSTDNKNTEFGEKRLGAATTLSKLFKDVLRVGGGYTIERVELTDVDSNASKTVTEFEGTNWLSRLRSFTTYDNRDNVYNPTKGRVLNLSAELVGSFLGGDQEFYIFRSGYTEYITFHKKHMVEFQTRLATSDAFGKSPSVPVFDRFFAGGLGTVRGYNYRRVGPMENGEAIGGQTMAIANLDYSFPVPMLDAFRGVVFVDAGQVSEDSYNVDFGKFAVSTGPGVKVKTPIGPLAFYYGFPMVNRDTKDRNGRFEFSLSRSF